MISGYIDISQVIYEACERLNISNSEAYEMRFLKLILDAELKISTGMITGPKINVYEPLSLSFVGGKKLLIPYDLVDNLSILDFQKKDFNVNKYLIKGQYIYFSEVQIDPIILTYNGIIFDINNSPVISRNHFEAVVSFIVYMETTTRYHSKKIAHYEYLDTRSWWQDRLSEARGDDAFPSDKDIKESSGLLHSVKLHLEYGVVDIVSANNIDQAITQYTNLYKLFYGILGLNDSITTAEGYSSLLLNPITESNTSVLSSNNFILTLSSPGRLVISVPFSSGNINSMIDSNNNDIFDGYFNIYVDPIRKITIYVAKEFLTIGSIKLTFGFV